jgi:hypothetical protein
MYLHVSLMYYLFVEIKFNDVLRKIMYYLCLETE